MKKAFTMLELIFVIVLVGILSYFAASGFSRNSLREAADQVISHIRYTQHLAMMDDKFDANNSSWFIEKWQVRFRLLLGEYGYVVFSDKDHNKNADLNEVAIDPLSSKEIDGFRDYGAANLTKKYGITDVASSCYANDGSLVTANKGVISFDSLGRPYNGVSNATAPLQYLMQNDCNITLGNSEGNVTITITKETGYTYISSQNY